LELVERAVAGVGVAPPLVGVEVPDVALLIESVEMDFTVPTVFPTGDAHD